MREYIRKYLKRPLKEYLSSREYVYENMKKPICLMDLATINMKEIKKKGLLDDKEESDEVNAASIEVDVDHRWEKGKMASYV